MLCSDLASQSACANHVFHRLAFPLFLADVIILSPPVENRNRYLNTTQPYSLRPAGTVLLRDKQATRKAGTMETRQLPTHIKISKKCQREFDAWTARIEELGLEPGKLVTAARVITDHRDYVLHKWEEPAVITELRNFDALVRFQDGTVKSSVDLRAFELPTFDFVGE